MSSRGGEYPHLILGCEITPKDPPFVAWLAATRESAHHGSLGTSISENDNVLAVGFRLVLGDWERVKKMEVCSGCCQGSKLICWLNIFIIFIWEAEETKGLELKKK